MSHWGAYALLGGLAVLRDEWRGALLDGMDPALDRAILEATVRDGPAVDGVTGRQEATIDSIDGAKHRQMLGMISKMIETERAGARQATLS